jgi:cupin 2 domain-containing protein
MQIKNRLWYIDGMNQNSKNQETVQNLFENIPASMPDEIFQDLIRSGDVRIERILSRGQATPEGQWYDQDRHEWILLLKGRAGLVFAGREEIVTLHAGDSLNIPAHVKHRVAWTDSVETTIWLAVHYR